MKNEETPIEEKLKALSGSSARVLKMTPEELAKLDAAIALVEKLREKRADRRQQQEVIGFEDRRIGARRKSDQKP